ncbi:MAG: glycosyltransferase family 2 protein, partial [Acidobacteriaceae bacterium]|nr:glycosyltransferase family 2 protein [Acidobacteriaceae bacterium]
MSPAPVQDDITVLMPCKDQKKEFFFDALQSMLQQTSSRWRLLVITDPASPPDLELWTESVQDNRIELLRCPNAGFARALNYGLSAANT